VDYQLDDVGCLEVDLSKFDRSCNSGSDCIIIANVLCPACACPGAAINVNGEARYEEAFSHRPPALLGPNGQVETCGCAADQTPPSLCLDGVCTYPQPQSPSTPPF
jgi:hypothetical protein